MAFSLATPVVTLCSTDPVLRGSAVADVLCDAPGAVVVQHDLSAGGGLRRTVFDRGGQLEAADVDLAHGCLSCALREDVLPALRRLARRRPTLLIAVLPIAAEPLPVVRMLQQPGALLLPAAVVTLVDADRFEEDLLGDATLAERGLALTADDDRALGEVLAHQVEYSDVLLSPADWGGRARRLAAHLATPPFRIDLRLLHEAGPATWASLVRPDVDPRGDLQRSVAPTAGDGHGIWTLDLITDRPLHPGRLLDRIEDLGSGRLRARGHFWLPTRPDVVCAWDGAGGQLSIGALGPWPARTRQTHLVITGTDADDPARYRTAFRDVQLTDAEYARGSRWWAGRRDDFDPWLGDVTECA